MKSRKTSNASYEEMDFVFPSFKASGRVPVSSCSFDVDHLRQAAKAAGVKIEDGQTIGCAPCSGGWVVSQI